MRPISQMFDEFSRCLQDVSEIVPKYVFVRRTFHGILPELCIYFLCSISTFCYFQIPCFHFHITLFKQILKPEFRQIPNYFQNSMNFIPEHVCFNFLSRNL